MKGKEEKPNKREKKNAGDERKADLWSIFKLDPPRGGQRASALSLNSHSALNSHSHTTGQESQDVSHSTKHDLTTLCATLATRQEALAQRVAPIGG